MWGKRITNKFLFRKLADLENKYIDLKNTEDTSKKGF
jgi:hypothetical protein